MSKGCQIVIVAIGALIAGIGLSAAIAIGALGLLATVPATTRWAVWTQSTTVAAIGLGFGGILVTIGWRSLRGYPHRDFALPGWGWWLASWFVVLVFGSFSRGFGWLALMPIWHILAISLPALLCLSFVTGVSSYWRGVNRRRILAVLTWGGLSAVGIIVVTQLITLFVSFEMSAELAASSGPGIYSTIEDIIQRMGVSQFFADLAARRLTSGTVLLYAVGIAPVMEELIKSVGVPLASSGERPSHTLDSFLYGVAAGVGFGLVEGLMNTMLATSAEIAWAPTMLVRGSTVAMHAVTTGLAGWGWHVALKDRRLAKGILLLLTAMAWHAAWNGIVVALTYEMSASIHHGLVVACAAGVFLMWLVSVLGLWFVPGRLGQASVGTGRLPMPSWDEVTGAHAFSPDDQNALDFTNRS